MRSAIALYTIDLEVEETVKFKNTINESGFITYSNTIYFSNNRLSHDSKYWEEPKNGSKLEN